jgi:hypothetical protein
VGVKAQTSCTSPSPSIPLPSREWEARHAPRALWLIAQNFLNTLYSLFGDPERIAFQHTLTKAAHHLLASWIRCGEALMRRLLLIEAAAYPKPNTPPLLRPTRKRARKLIGFDDDKPETWRVSFRCFASPARAKRAPAKAKPARRFASAWPLAERYEALIRVFNAPAPYAQRLAKRLHALKHRLAEILRAAPEAEHRIERFEALTHAAAARWRLDPNSS